MDFYTLLHGAVKATVVPGPWLGRLASVSDALSSASRRNRDGGRIARGWDEKELRQRVERRPGPVSCRWCPWLRPCRPCHQASFPSPPSLSCSFPSPPIPLSLSVSPQHSDPTFSMNPGLHPRYPFPQARWQNRDLLDGLGRYRESRSC
jgi:hypothetical protein